VPADAATTTAMNDPLKLAPNPDAVRADAGARADATAPAGTPQGAAPARPLPDDALIIVPVRNVVLFPGMVFPLTVGRPRSIAAVQEAVRLQRPLGILLQTRPDVDEPGANDLHRVGSDATVLRYVTGNEGTHHAVCKGERRFRVLEFLDGWPFTVARVQFVDEFAGADSDI